MSPAWRWVRAGAAGLLSVVAVPAATGGEFRLFAGAFHHQWRTDGPHGHRLDCRTRECEDEDWRRGNLDSSMGLRLGVERVAWRRGQVEALVGAELDALFTEYDLSQRDVTVLEATAVAGLARRLGGVRLAVRLGAGGAATTDGRRGGAGFGELGLAVPLDDGAELRLGVRRSFHGGPHSDDLSLLLVSTGADAERSPWDVELSAGTALAGTGPGSSLGLASGPLWQIAALHPLRTGVARLGAVLGSARRASRYRGLYGAIPGNQRGREVWSLGLVWDRRLWRRTGWEGGLTASVWAADWEDDGALLVNDAREKVVAGIEAGGAIGIQMAVPIRARSRLLLGVEQGYWPTLGMGELRARVGLGVVGLGADRWGDTERGSRGQASLPRRLASDLGLLLRRPAHLDGADWRRLGWGTAAVAAAALLDDTIRGRVRDGSSEGSADLAQSFRPVSFWGPLVGLGVTWAGARVADDERARIVAEDGLEAVLLTVLVTVPVLKEVTGRARPTAGKGSGSFSPFSGEQSFPSGEVAQAFALAWVAQQHESAPWVRVGLWGFAGAVVWSRLELDGHWASDTVAGALVGVAMAEWVVRRKRSIGKVSWAVTPVPAREGVVVRGSVSW